LLRAVVLLLLVCVGVALAVKTCPKCGTANPDEANFCKSCGAKLPEPEPRFERPPQPRVKVEVMVAAGVVTVVSEPADAAVTIDGQSWGRTPIDVKGLAPGRHELTVSKAGYRDYNGTFMIAARQGTVVVTTEPVGAEVLLDGVFRGVTGQTGLVLAPVSFGQHTVQARLAGYQEATKTVDVNTTGPIGVFIRLTTGKGYLHVRTQGPHGPIAAAVTANGQQLGKSELVAELIPNRYVVMVTQRGFQDWTGYAQVAAGETTQVTATLERLKTVKPPILVLGGAVLAGGIWAGVQGELTYARYRTTTEPADAETLRRSTQQWDMFRNVGVGAGAALIGLFFVLRW